MKQFLLALILLAGGEHQRGLSLYAEGDYLGAAQAFRAALAKDPDNAEIAYNLALARWRAGDAEAAETAAERAATLSDGALSHLRDGLLGTLRYAAAQAKQSEDLPAALELAERARSNFLRGALSEAAGPALRRNLERANLLIDEIKKQIEEQEGEESEEGEEDQQEQGNEENQENEDQKQPDPKQGEEQDQEPKPEQGEEQNQEPTPEQGEEPEPEPKQLSSEQSRRLLEALERSREQKQEMRARMRLRRPKVKKDW